MTDRLGWGGTNTRSLIAKEEKQLIMPDGAADCSAELVLPQRVGFGGKEVARVPGAIAWEFKAISMPLIRAGLGHHVHGATGMEAILRRQRACVHAEFLDRVGKWKRQVDISHRVVIVTAIK